MSTVATGVFNRVRLRRMAGAEAFESGAHYVASGRIAVLQERDGRCMAVVNGTQPYRVALWIENRDVKFSCNCPAGDRGRFCKHCVAVGLRWLENSLAGERAPCVSNAPDVVINGAASRDQLLAQDKEALVDFLLQQAQRDERLCQNIIQWLAPQEQSPFETYRRELERAIRSERLSNEDDNAAYVQRVLEASLPMEHLLKAGQAHESLRLAEHALRVIEETVSAAEDDPQLQMLIDALREVHYLGCTAANQEPAVLARRLFELQYNSTWDVYQNTIEKYAEILGKEGLAEYQRLAESAWLEGIDKFSSSARPKRMRALQIMQLIAQRTGEVERVIALQQRDLSSPSAYLRIVATYQAVARHDDALNWAERGLRAFNRMDPRLREFVADEYHRRGDRDRAMLIIWQAFVEAPTLESYQNLQRHAHTCGMWDSWRDTAHVFLAETIVRKKSVDRRSNSHFYESSELVRILLSEGDIEGAAQVVAEHGCFESTRRQFEAQRELLDSGEISQCLPALREQDPITVDL